MRLLIISALLTFTAILFCTATALACGIYIPREGDGVISQERALIRHVDGVETIVLELAVSGETSEAVWILPVPNPATVELGDDAIFDELEAITAPRIETRYIDLDREGVGAAAPGSGVTIFSQQTLGPFEVTSLTGDDAEAVAAWLEENGYDFPEELPEVIAPYIEDEWAFAAVKLTPEAGGEIAGQLDPLAFTFESDEIVYPLRPAALGQGSRPLFLYVLAENMMYPAHLTTAPYASELLYADFISPETLTETSSLSAYVTAPLFLTKHLVQLWDVTQVKEDLYYLQAPQNTPYQGVEYRYEPRPSPLANLARCSWLPALGIVSVGAVMWRKKRVH